MWDITTVIGVLLFFLTILLHEVIHFLAAKHFKLNPRFSWISSREKNTVGVFGVLPGIRFEDTNDIHIYKWVALSPIPFCIVGFFFMYIVFFWKYWSNVTWVPWDFIVLGVVIVVSVIAGLMASIVDIEDYKKKKEMIFDE